MAGWPSATAGAPPSVLFECVSIHHRVLALAYNISVFSGSYLDPLADKVLICSTVAALGAEVLDCTFC